MDVYRRSGFALFFRPGAAHTAATAFGLHQWIVARACTCEFAALLGPDLNGDTRKTQTQEANAKQNCK